MEDVRHARAEQDRAERDALHKPQEAGVLGESHEEDTSTDYPVWQTWLSQHQPVDTPRIGLFIFSYSHKIFVMSLSILKENSFRI